MPAIAPLAGGSLVSLLGWRWVFVLCALYGCTLLAWMWTRFGESLPADRRNGAPLSSVLRRYAALLRSPAFAGYAANFALLSTPFMAFISVAPALLIERLGMSPATYGLYHLLLGAAIVAGGFSAPRIALRVGLHRALVLSTAVGIAGWGLLLVLSGELTVARLMGPMLLYALASGACLPLALTGATGVDLKAAGASAALAGFGQMALGAIAVVVVNQFGVAVLPVALFGFGCAVAGLAALVIAR
jgi:DHA1 family bicyclomycin/chloramphenicol resistance-like MFS transporter